jgi:photosystem II stability/assembly factor-like uncharacterized protein
LRPIQVIGSIIAATLSAAGMAQAPEFTDITPPETFARVSDVAVHPLEPGRLLAMDNGAVRLSEDGGATWSAPGNIRGRMWIHPGLPGVVFAQADGSRHAGLGIMRFGGELYRSSDFGRSWEQLRPGYQADGELSVAPFGVDPANPERILATERTAASYASAGASSVPAKSVSVVQSLDGGRTWGPSLAGAGPNGIRHVEPPTPAAPRRMFMSTRDVGAYMSLDGGGTWRRIDVDGVSNIAWIRQDPQNADVLYAFAEQPRASVYGPVEGSILRSSDGGATWPPVFAVHNSQSHDYYGVDVTLTVDPMRAGRLWLAGLEAGVYLSEDSGRTWSWLGFRADGATCDCSGIDGSTIVSRVVPSLDDTTQAYLVHKNRLFKVTLPQRTRVAVEYRYGDRFWLAVDAAEAGSQDYRGNEALRTGLTFALWSAADAPAGAVGTCRFQGNPSRGQSSRFITLQGAECEGLRGQPAFVLEGENESYAMPAGADGSCAVGLARVTRFYNGQRDVNHRWVADPAAVNEMRARGWIEEGTAFCARPLGSNE